MNFDIINKGDGYVILIGDAEVFEIPASKGKAIYDTARGLRFHRDTYGLNLYLTGVMHGILVTDYTGETLPFQVRDK